MLNKILHVLLLLTCGLNLYIHNYPRLHRCSFDDDASLKLLAFGDPQITGAGPRTDFRKRLDIKGNDLFLKHTVSTLRNYLRPDAVFVMGDLISSQWIPTDEFHNRADRFTQIFPSMGHGQIYNLSGNHDIGYHGEMTQERVDRYIDRYGKLNYAVALSEGVRLVAINSLALDGPPRDQYYEQVHTFLDDLEPFDGQSILLTHVPLYKPAGICRDGPMFQYYNNGNVRAQNHLSFDNSLKLLQRVFGSKSGIILAGHDHEGCYASYTFSDDSLHVFPGLEGGLPEVTVRSLMGEFGGNGGLLSAIKDSNGYKFDFKLCRFQVQHIWWVTEVVTYVTLTVATLRGCLWLLSGY